MNWNDLPRSPSSRMLRQFGGLASGICLVFAGSTALSSAGTGTSAFGIWAWLAAGLTVGSIALLRPQTLRLVFVGWLIIAFPIGWIVGRLALAAMFFGLFTPVGLVFRMMGRDPMGRRRRADSYWTARDESTSPADYLRQY